MASRWAREGDALGLRVDALDPRMVFLGLDAADRVVVALDEHVGSAGRELLSGSTLEHSHASLTVGERPHVELGHEVMAPRLRHQHAPRPFTGGTVCHAQDSSEVGIVDE